MGDELSRDQLADVIDRANEFLGYSIDRVVGVREAALASLRSIDDELERTRSEIDEVRQSRDELADVLRSTRGDRASPGREADRSLKVRASLDERERALRTRRDDLQRRRARCEETLSLCSNTMGKLRLASEIAANRIDAADTVSTARSADEMDSVVLSLQFAENEYKRIAREIHDGPVQQFSAVLLMFDYLARVVRSGDQGTIESEIARIKRELQTALVDFRGFLRRLQPAGLDVGLGRALLRFAETFTERTGAKLEVSIDSEEDSLPIVLRTNIFRVVQEAANNAVRHGGASNISVSSSISIHELRVTIRDDGCGFDVEASRALAAERGSFGLTNMRERIYMADGAMHIASERGNGTEISVTVPIGGEDDER